MAETKRSGFHFVLVILAGVGAGVFSFATLTPNLLSLLRSSAHGGLAMLSVGFMAGFVAVPLFVISSVLLSAAVGVVVSVIVHRLLDG